MTVGVMISERGDGEVLMYIFGVLVLGGTGKRRAGVLRAEIMSLQWSSDEMGCRRD